jgi:hypothetical protein
VTLSQWHAKLRLTTLVDRLEGGAHLVEEAAQYVSNWDPEDMERRYVAEQLALHQSDLQQLRPLLEQLGILE